MPPTARAGLSPSSMELQSALQGSLPEADFLESATTKRREGN